MAWRALMAMAMAALCLNFSRTADAADCAALPRAHMRLRLTTSDSPLVDSGTAIQTIVSETWRPYGLTFDWAVDPISAAPSRVDAWIAAVRGGPVAFDGGDLGRVLFDHDVPRPMILISINAVIAWVQRQQAARFQTDTQFPQPTLGETASLSVRALGHVAAHELGHFVLGRRSHADSGLMSGIWRWDPQRAVRLLRSEALLVDAGSAARLNARLKESASCP